MTHQKHTPETSDRPLTNAEELGKDAELFADEEPLQLTYDPAKLGTLTAEAMDKIEDEVWADRDAGRTPAQVQHAIYAKLERLGIDPSTAQGDVLVMRFTGVDGKSDIRPVVIGAHDFGTRVRNAELTAVEAPVDEEAVDPEEERRQERLIDEIFEEQLAAVRRLEGPHQEYTQYYNSRRESLDQLIAGVKIIAAPLARGEMVSIDAIRQLAEGIAPEARRLMNNEAEHSGEERSMASNASASLESAASTAPNRVSEERSAQVSPVLQKARAIAQGVASNRQINNQVSEQMQSSVTRVANILSDALDSRHGHEMFGAHLNQTIHELEQLSGRHDGLSVEFPGLLRQLKEALVRTPPDS